MAVIAMLVGLALGLDGLDLLRLDPRGDLIGVIAAVALVGLLFRDGLEVEDEMLRSAWGPPLRKLALGMPITAGIVAVVTHAVTDLDWTQSFLVGALLSPTDPVLSSSVVTNPRVPRLIRHSLNLESGLNDGLALAPVLALSAALEIGRGEFTWWTFVIQDVGVGLLAGVVVGLVAAAILPARGRAVFALATPAAAYALAIAPPHGNGLIAAFVCAIVLGIRRPELLASVEAAADRLVEFIKIGVFVVFGSLLTLDGLFGDPTAVAIVAITLFVARPVAVFVSLAGTRLGVDVKAFMAWFGPKGVATMTFALLVLGDAIPDNEQIFDIAALAVFCSVLLHGLTDRPGAEWIARRAARPAPAP